MQECHSKGGFAGHALQVAVEAQFGIDLHPQDVDGVLDGKDVFAKPQLSCKQPGVLTRSCYKDGLGLLSCKLDLLPPAPGQDVVELTIGGINHVRGLFSGVAVREGAVISICRCHRKILQEVIEVGVPQEVAQD